MSYNELFRMVSLRQSRPTTSDRSARPDPRARHAARIAAQAVVTEPPRVHVLAELKKRRAQLSETLKLRESIQRVVVDAYVTALDVPAPRTADAVARRRPTAGERHGSNLEIVPLASTIERRLGATAASVFRSGIGTLLNDTHADLSELMEVLDTGGVVAELNALCMEIHAVEVATTGLPTAPGTPSTASRPLVAAVGWGDLVLARESLVGYAAREIAHIENILPGETKLREHERRSYSEELQESETLTERETEKDSQSTDRYELQAQSQEAISQSFSISTGVNTSGQYGLTKVDTSLDGAFSQSESSSRSNSINTAREVVSKAVERTFESVRRLRRLTLSEHIKELNRHKLSNDGDSRAAISGMYLFVEKIQKVELRHYGTRMMVEFHIPEPALSLLERTSTSHAVPTLPPFDVSPTSIEPGNYLCEAQRYGALDVTPPPPLFIQVGWGWNSKIFEDGNQWGEDSFHELVQIPSGYRPLSAKVAWSGLQGKTENREFNFSFAVGGRSQENVEHTVTTYDGVVLKLRADTDWPQGVPVSGRVHGTWDGAMYVHVTLTCMRTTEALDAWRIRTWQALRVGHETLERKLAQQQQRTSYQDELLSALGQMSTSSEYRRLERGELQKWAIKCMRLVPQNFNAIAQVGTVQEVDPGSSEAQAPIVRFYEDSFEWQHMTFFLYPYHWARRASWNMRTSTKAPDLQHQAFLEAGAARVIVPVTPGFEDKVAWFLDENNPATTELERVLAQPPSSPPAVDDPFRDLWIELLTDQRAELAKGSGTLGVTSGSADATVNEDSQWRLADPRDVRRELYIAGERYEISAVVGERRFKLDRDYQGSSDPAAAYVAGSTPFGPPWNVNIPTSLIVLADNVDALKAL